MGEKKHLSLSWLPVAIGIVGTLGCDGMDTRFVAVAAFASGLAIVLGTLLAVYRDRGLVDAASGLALISAATVVLIGVVAGLVELRDGGSVHATTTRMMLSVGIVVYLGVPIGRGLCALSRTPAPVATRQIAPDDAESAALDDDYAEEFSEEFGEEYEGGGYPVIRHPGVLYAESPDWSAQPTAPVFDYPALGYPTPDIEYAVPDRPHLQRPQPEYAQPEYAQPEYAQPEYAQPEYVAAQYGEPDSSATGGAIFLDEEPPRPTRAPVDGISTVIANWWPERGLVWLPLIAMIMSGVCIAVFGEAAGPVSFSVGAVGLVVGLDRVLHPVPDRGDVGCGVVMIVLAGVMFVGALLVIDGAGGLGAPAKDGWTFVSFAALGYVGLVRYRMRRYSRRRRRRLYDQLGLRHSDT